jgi:hypothetical protein
MRLPAILQGKHELPISRISSAETEEDEIPGLGDIAYTKWACNKAFESGKVYSQF